jgi:hypothetical protein
MAWPGASFPSYRWFYLGLYGLHKRFAAHSEASVAINKSRKAAAYGKRAFDQCVDRTLHTPAAQAADEVEYTKGPQPIAGDRTMTKASAILLAISLRKANRAFHHR